LKQLWLASVWTALALWPVLTLAADAGGAGAPHRHTILPKKKTVALLCYGDDESTRERCKHMKRLLSAKGCDTEVRLEEFPANADAPTLRRAAKELNLGPGTTVIVAGHTGNIERRVEVVVDPKTKQKLKRLEPLEVWRKRVEAGGENSFTLGENRGEILGKQVRDTLQASIPESALWFSTCGAGGLCRPEGCVGGSCQATELTSLPRTGNWIDPPTRQIINLLCDPKLREAADKDKNGTVEESELNEIFRCDAQKYPPTYTQHIFPSEAFLATLKKEVDETAKQKKIQSYMEEGDDHAKKQAIIYLGELLLYPPSLIPDDLDKGRARVIQAQYRKRMIREGVYDEKLGELNLPKLRELIRFETRAEGRDYHVISASLPPPDVAPDCYWGGVETYFPHVKHFKLPTH